MHAFASGPSHVAPHVAWHGVQTPFVARNSPSAQLSWHLPLDSAGLSHGNGLHLRQSVGSEGEQTSQSKSAHSAQPTSVASPPLTATLYLLAGQSRRQLVWPP